MWDGGGWLGGRDNGSGSGGFVHVELLSRENMKLRVLFDRAPTCGLILIDRSFVREDTSPNRSRNFVKFVLESCCAALSDVSLAAGNNDVMLISKGF